MHLSDVAPYAPATEAAPYTWAPSVVSLPGADTVTPYAPVGPPAAPASSFSPWTWALVGAAVLAVFWPMLKPSRRR